VGLNSDASVKKLKGETRPIHDEQSRALVLAALQWVDAVVTFDTTTPEELIKILQPDILVKGGDYTISQIAGADFVISNGGQVHIVPLVEGFSTTGILEKK
jgi:D-beta-D-heptose 7-phosphate kinase/D-beta-D-heptose 1-phosphate adenosyltransferase